MASLAAFQQITPRATSAHWSWRWSLARTFFVTHFGVVLSGVVVTGVWIGNQIESGVLNRTAGATARYLDSLITPRLHNLATSAWLTTDQISDLDSLVTGTALGQGVAVFKIWSPDGHVLYSRDRTLIGEQLPRPRNSRRPCTARWSPI